MIGGKGERRLLQAAARWADHYNYPGSDVDDFSYRLEVLADWCARLGRDRSRIETSLQIGVEDVPAAVELAGRAVEAGADHVIFYLPPPPTVSLIEEVAEAARELA